MGSVGLDSSRLSEIHEFWQRDVLFPTVELLEWVKANADPRRCFPPFPLGSISLREEFLPLDRIRRLVRSPTFAHRKVKEMRERCRAELRKGFPKENSDLAAWMLAARTRICANVCNEFCQRPGALDDPRQFAEIEERFVEGLRAIEREAERKAGGPIIGLLPILKRLTQADHWNSGRPYVIERGMTLMEPPGTARGLPRPDGEMHDILTMRGPWKVEVGELMRQRGIVQLSVCDLYGWKGHSIGFLRTLPDLKELQLRCFVLFDISPLHSLSKLQTLVLLVRFPGELNFSRFPLIEHLLIDWSPRARSLLRAETLRHLHLNSCFDFRDLSPLSALRRLESLGMADGSLESLDGIEALDQLNTLHLAGLPKLRSLAPLRKAPRLRELLVQRCPRIDPVGARAELSVLPNLDIQIDTPDWAKADSVRSVR